MSSSSSIEVGRLFNGMRVVYVPCDAESVAVGLFIASGSRHESAKYAGISHFIEHMLFKGTPSRRPVDITREIEGRGGNFNACTGEEATTFYIHLPSDYLEESLDILADMYLNATIPDDEFEREKAVIVEELKMYADDPESVVMENLQRAIFPKSHLGAPVGGTVGSLAPMRPGDLRDYISTHYLPSNTVLVIAGDFDTDVARAIAERLFGRCNRRGRAPGIDCATRGEPVAEVRAERDIVQTQLAVGYRGFGMGHPLKYAAAVMDAALGRGMSSRLFQEVREKRGLSYDISSRLQFFDDASMFAISAGLDGAKAKQTLAVIDRELKRIVEKRMPAKELARVKEFLNGNFRLSYEKVTTKMFYFGQTMLSFGRLVPSEEQLAQIRAVDPAMVQAAAGEIFKSSNRSVSWVTPKIK